MRVRGLLGDCGCGPALRDCGGGAVLTRVLDFYAPLAQLAPAQVPRLRVLDYDACLHLSCSGGGAVLSDCGGGPALRDCGGGAVLTRKTDFETHLELFSPAQVPLLLLPRMGQRD